MTAFSPTQPVVRIKQDAMDVQDLEGTLRINNSDPVWLLENLSLSLVLGERERWVVYAWVGLMIVGVVITNRSIFSDGWSCYRLFLCCG